MKAGAEIAATVDLPGERADGYYLPEMGTVLYVIDPDDGSDDIVLLYGRSHNRLRRDELVALLEAEQV